MVGLIIGALVLVLAILMAYQRYVAGKKPVQHLCDYCGHMVTAVSDCHHHPCGNASSTGRASSASRIAASSAPGARIRSERIAPPTL